MDSIAVVIGFVAGVLFVACLVVGLWEFHLQPRLEKWLCTQEVEPGPEPVRYPDWEELIAELVRKKDMAA